MANGKWLKGSGSALLNNNDQTEEAKIYGIIDLIVIYSTYKAPKSPDMLPCAHDFKDDGTSRDRICLDREVTHGLGQCNTDKLNMHPDQTYHPGLFPGASEAWKQQTRSLSPSHFEYHVRFSF